MIIKRYFYLPRVKLSLLTIHISTGDIVFAAVLDLWASDS